MEIFSSFAFEDGLMHPLELMRLHPEKTRTQIASKLYLSEEVLRRYDMNGKNRRSPSAPVRALAYLRNLQFLMEKEPGT